MLKKCLFIELKKIHIRKDSKNLIHFIRSFFLSELWQFRGVLLELQFLFFIFCFVHITVFDLKKKKQMKSGTIFNSWCLVKCKERTKAHAWSLDFSFSALSEGKLACIVWPPNFLWRDILSASWILKMTGANVLVYLLMKLSISSGLSIIQSLNHVGVNLVSLPNGYHNLIFWGTILLIGFVLEYHCLIVNRVGFVPWRIVIAL